MTPKEIETRLNEYRAELETLQRRLEYETGETLSELNRRCGEMKSDAVFVSEKL